MNRWWLSWYSGETTTEPESREWPVPGLLGYWCSGWGAGPRATMCALVVADDEHAAWQIIREQFVVDEFRFTQAHDGKWTPGDRFPMPEEA